MQQNFQTTKAPTVGSNVGPGYPPNASWSNPGNITADDANSASTGFFEGGQGSDELVASAFGFALPSFAKIDGIAVRVDGSQTGSFGNVFISPTGATFKDAGALNQTYGGATDLWGADEIDVADINSGFTVSIQMNDVSGGDGIASVEFVQVTIYWHVDLSVAPADVPTRVDYKVYSREGTYLGLLPVTNPFAFTQDMNSAGSTLQLTCSKGIDDGITTEPLQEEDNDLLLTEDDQTILATLNSSVVARGADAQEALYKNSNRVKVWMYNYWYPNGKLMFSGQVNRVSFQYGGGGAGSISLAVLSDGIDLGNLIARGSPFTYTNDVSQTSQNGFVTVSGDAFTGGWYRIGQTIKTAVGTTNIGAIVLKLQGSATVTVSMYDAVNGNFLASITKNVSYGGATDEQFNFPNLVTVPSNTLRFYTVAVAPGQSINVYRHGTSSTYADGGMFESSYSGGSGGGSYGSISGDLYFITKRGTPTTTTTYSSQDPITGMMRGILADYNTRGGYIHERDFVAAGYNLTYVFNLMSIFDSHKKVLEMSPTGYYSYIDLGTAEMDMLPMSSTADFTVVRGRDIVSLNLSLSIEQVKNYLLFTGGETAGVNLFRQYQDAASAGYYGTRMATKSDNRVTQTGTADAIGDSFKAENKDETQETSITVPVTAMDHTLLTPGKTIGFRNFGNFIDDMVLQIVRREFNVNSVTLTLGRLPVRMNDEVQRIQRELLNEQTIKNPSNPS